MKIVKYVFILILLGIISLSVFVATKDGTYHITHEKTSDIAANSVYKYITDLRNYEQWNPDESKEIKTDSIYKGLKAKATSAHSTIEITKVDPNQSIEFTLVQNGAETKNKITLSKAKEQATKITLDTEGSLSFVQKFKSLFLGGAESIVGAPYEKMLNNINFHLKEELEKYELKSEGIVLVKETYFIQQLIVTKIENLGEKVFESMENMTNFVKMNDFIKIAGKPFTFFGQMNVGTGEVEYYVCLPIDKEIFTSEGSDITFGKIPAHYAYKTILTGDYTHSDKAWNKNNEDIASKKLTHNYTIKPRAVFTNSILDTHKPSQWITEMLTPVNESVIPIQETPETTTTVTTTPNQANDSIQ